MGKDINIVLEGCYKGNELSFDEKAGLVWIGYRILDDNSNCFYKDVVESVEKLNEKESDVRDHVNFWLGSHVAAGMSTIKEYIVLVKWKSGEDSLIRVTAGVYEIILCNMQKNVLTTNAGITLLKGNMLLNKNQRLYSLALELYESNDYEKIKRALEIFESIKTYRFSESYISKCEEKMNTPEIRAQKEKLNKTQRKNLMSGFILALVLLGIAIGLFVIGNELF